MQKTLPALALFLWIAGLSCLFAQDAGTKELTYEELTALIASKTEKAILIDVRAPEEFKSGAIPTAINIPYDTIEKNLPTQDRAAKIVVYCRSGNRSSIAKATLEKLGFTNVINFGAVSKWRGQLIIRQ